MRMYLCTQPRMHRLSRVVAHPLRARGSLVKGKSSSRTVELEVSPFRAATGRWISFSAAQFAEEKAAESEAPTEPVPEADEAPVEEAEVETEEVDPAVELALKDVEESDDMPGSGPREMKKPDRIVWKKAVPFTHVLKKRSEMYEYRRAYERIYDRLQLEASDMDTDAAKEELATAYTDSIVTSVLGVETYQAPTEDDAARYTAIDPALADDWEDLHWRSLKTGGYTNDRERVGGDYGGFRLPTGITPPAKAYYRAMINCIRDGQYSTVLELYDAIVKDEEIDSDEIPAGVYRQLMLAHIGLGDILGAEAAFRGVLKWNAATPTDYEHMMDLYFTNALLHRGTELWSGFIVTQLAPTERLGKLVVALYSLQKNLSNTSKAIASLGKLGVHVSEKDVAPLLLEFYGANGWREEAIELYSSLKATSSPDQPLPASIVGRMMQLHNTYEKWDDALALYETVKESRDTFVHDMAIRAHVGLGKFEEAMELLGGLLEKRVAKLSTFAPVVQLAIRSGNADAVGEILEQMQAEGLDSSSSAIHNAKIAGAVADLDQAAVYYREMLDAGVEPDEHTLRYLIESAVQANKWVLVLQLWDKITARKHIRITKPRVFSLVFYALYQSGNFADAVRIYGNFLSRGASIRPDEATAKNMLLAVVSDPTKLRFITRDEFMQRIKKDQPRSMTVSEADKLKMFLGTCLHELAPKPKPARGFQQLDFSITW